MIRKRSLGGRIISNTGLRRVYGGQQKATPDPKPAPDPDKRQQAPSPSAQAAIRSIIGVMH